MRKIIHLCIFIFSLISIIEIKAWYSTPIPPGAFDQIADNSAATRAWKNIVFYESPNNGDPGQRNDGLVAYFRDQFNNGPCLRNMVVNFYNEIERRDAGYSFNHGPTRGVPALSERVGTGHYSNLNSGWIWDRAMQHSNNNPNLAMALLGFCGHDNTEQGEFKWVDSSPEAMARRDQQISNLRAAISDPNQRSLIGKHQAALAKLESVPGIDSSFNCPNTRSSMFVAGSLGVDIPNELKERIASIQAPNAGAAGLSSKYYHVYASAFMGCVVRQHGGTPGYANTLQTEAAKGYRAMALCPDTRNDIGKRNALVQFFRRAQAGPRVFRAEPGESISDFYARIIHEDFNDPNSTCVSRGIPLQQRPAHCSAKGGGNPDDPACNQPSESNQSEERRHPKCNAIANMDIERESGLTLEQVKSQVDLRFEKMNAAQLYHDWYLGGGTALFGQVDIPCTNFRVRGTLTTSDNGLSRWRNPECLDGFSAEDCDRAKRRLGTWELDVDWTGAQHDAGSTFGGNRCQPDDRSFEQMACEAQPSAPTNNSSTDAAG